MTSPTLPSSPLMTPAPSSGLSSIAERERKSRAASGSGVGGIGSAGFSGEEMDTTELEDVEEEEGGDEEGEGEESDGVDEAKGGELQRGMEGERMVKSGFLYKKQERRKAWKKKWFVLRTGKLAYYKDEKEYSLRRVIDLKTVQTVAPVTVKKHPFTFGIVTPKRTFFAKALSQDEMDDWVRTINNARRRLSEREEEDKSRKVSAATSNLVASGSLPRQDRRASVDDQGTYPAMTPGGSMTTSPITMTGGNYLSQAGSPIASSSTSPAVSKPMNIPIQSGEYNLTSQVARLNLSGSVSPTISMAPRLPSQRVVSGASTRRDPSASSYGSSAAAPQDYFGPAIVNNALSNSGTTWSQPAPSSDEESFSDHPQSLAGTSLSAQPSLTLNMGHVAPVDPKKIILQAYLMKRSKGRGRKVWRKRWFYLTSQGLTYTKSHMDSRPLRFIPLSTVLDALEVNPDDDQDLSDESDSDAGDAGYVSPVLSRQFTGSRRSRRPDDTARPDKPGMGENEHLFRLITAKRTFVLCAPSEEDEIKWLAAFRALLNREREKNRFSATGSPLSSPALDTGPGRFAMAQQQYQKGPSVALYPPTPSTTSTVQLRSPSVSEGTNSLPVTATSQGPPVSSSSASYTNPGMRARSATYIAKGAVADVTRRFHPEKEGQA
ncbi:hypothetical protein BD324DRAFT_617135 [Kockovaella imperatae]|uniref:PH domain-containing protein n=1 Tax=Kockovaella imperatae TaxID=4999 RepID=A0A1Y1UQG2_9TREE|nr:hypothetical protein BD324DRAFT_617135 [Kockovaella imperatae]ORX40273.1 hypothetical protein BD324DRAFT_617135 [Kockovaella imperatae]